VDIPLHGLLQSEHASARVTEFNGSREERECSLYGEKNRHPSRVKWSRYPQLSMPEIEDHIDL